MNLVFVTVSQCLWSQKENSCRQEIKYIFLIPSPAILLSCANKNKLNSKKTKCKIIKSKYIDFVAEVYLLFN